MNIRKKEKEFGEIIICHKACRKMSTDGYTFHSLKRVLGLCFFWRPLLIFKMSTITVYCTISLFNKYFSWNYRWCPTIIIVTSNLSGNEGMVCKINRELFCILTLGISFMLLFAAYHTMINMQVCLFT